MINLVARRDHGHVQTEGQRNAGRMRWRSRAWSIRRSRHATALQAGMETHCPDLRVFSAWAAQINDTTSDSIGIKATTSIAARAHGDRGSIRAGEVVNSLKKKARPKARQCEPVMYEFWDRRMGRFMDKKSDVIQVENARTRMMLRSTGGRVVSATGMNYRKLSNDELRYLLCSRMPHMISHRITDAVRETTVAMLLITERA